MFTNEELFAAGPREEWVPVRDKTILVCGMSGTDRDLWEQQLSAQRIKCGDKGYPHFRASLVIRTARNDDRSLRFMPDQLKQVSNLPADILSALYDAGASLSGVTKEDAKKLGEDSTASEDSTSDSPAT